MEWRSGTLVLVFCGDPLLIVTGISISLVSCTFPALPNLRGSPDSFHNYLRISRILKCLSEVGLEYLNAGFILHVLNEQSEHGSLNSSSLRKSMDRWWTNCIRNDEERRWLNHVVGRVREKDLLFDRAMYEECLRNRQSVGRLLLPSVNWGSDTASQ